MMNRNADNRQTLIVFSTPSPIRISIDQPKSKEELIQLLHWLDRHARLAGLSWPDINEARHLALSNVQFAAAETEARDA
jgi:hypothetical protein